MEEGREKQNQEQEQTQEKTEKEMEDIFEAQGRGAEERKHQKEM